MNKKEFFSFVLFLIVLAFGLGILILVLENGISLRLPREDPFKPTDALIERMWLKMKFHWPYSLLGFCGLIGMITGIQKSINLNGFHISKWFGFAALSFITVVVSCFKIFG